MKKIFTSLMMLGCVAAMSAQGLAIQKGAEGEVVYANGETVVIPVEQTYFDETYFMLVWDPEFYIKASSACSATVTLDSPKGIVQFCGGDIEGCVSTSTTNPAVKAFTLKANVPKAMKIDIMDMTGLYPFSGEDLEATVTAKAGSETYTLNLVFQDPTTNGVKEVSAEAVAVGVVGRTLNFNVATPTQITLYTISGQPALTRTVNGAGSISLDSLPGGVYLYRAGARTGKFVVR